ncbi:TonB-dependent receptor [bacterium]|nr:TonB-dependent receptor [bacterium]
MVKVILALMLVAIQAMTSSAGTIRGMVHDGETMDVLVGASVVVEGTARGAATNPKGFFTIANLEAGTYTLKISMLGYGTLDTSASVGKSDTVMLHLMLKPSAVEIGEVKIETERTQSGVSMKEPTRTEVIRGEDLQARSTDGKLMTALQGKTGLRTKPCALCGSMGIGLQGLDPSYTEVNVDGMPVLSGLGTLYGMDGLSVSDVKELQVTKGSGSNLFGSGAIAGAVNLVSVKPARSKSFSGNVSMNNNAQNTVALSASGLTGKLPMRISLLNSAEPNYVDEDEDGLTDTPKYRRFNGQIGIAPRVGRGDLRFGARTYSERRFAGETNWSAADRGSAVIYGREIFTDRNEISAKYESLAESSLRWFVEGAGVLHKHRSWYGATEYNADQRLILGKGSLKKEWTPRSTTVAEAFFNHQNYDDNLELATKTDLIYNTPGLTLEHTIGLDESQRVMLQGGTKVEYWKEWGVEFVPRGSLLWRPDIATGVRLSAGSGFRPVSIFSLEEATMAGFANVAVPSTLEPDRSIAGSFAVNRQWVGREAAFTLDVSTFYTHFTRKVVLRYGDHADHTVYTNSPKAYSAGAELQAGFTTTSGWSLDAGGRISQSKYKDEMGVMRNAEFQNEYTLSSSLRKSFPKANVTAELSNAVYGPQYIPAGRARDKSPAFATWDIGVSKAWKQFTLSASVKNLFDWTQSDDPYLRDEQTGDLLLDSSLIYGPLLGRTAALSLAWRWSES